ncbi:MAG TPA: hypothetical protein VH306_10785 [Gaiellaceae bacterium]
MKLAPLYSIRFAYPEHYTVRGADVVGYFFAEGRCEGEVTGRFRGLNTPRLRHDDVYLPDFQGVIETDDGARIGFDLRGVARRRDYGREVVATILHHTGDSRYVRLNEAVCVVAGEARRGDIVLEVAEVVWEPPAV